MKYKTAKEFFEKPVSKRVSDQVDNTVKYIDSIYAKYPYLNNKEFSILYTYFHSTNELTGNKKIAFKTYKSRFINGELGPGAIFNLFLELNYKPKIVV